MNSHTLSEITLEAICYEQGRPFIWLSKGDYSKTRLLKSITGEQIAPFRSAEMYCGQVANATIFGKSYISDRIGRAVFVNQSHRNYHKREFVDYYKKEILDEDAPHPIISTECCFLGGLSGNTRYFGHFIFEFLYRLVAFEMCGLLNRLPVAVFDTVPTPWLSFLELYGVSPERILKIPQHPAPRFNLAWVASCPNFMAADRQTYAFWDDGIHSLRERLIAKAAQTQPAGPKRVYIGRKGASHRRIINEEEVWGFLQSEGFIYPDFAGKPAAEQIATISSAEVIVSVAGSASVMTHFAPPQCSIIEIAPPNIAGGLGSMGVATVLGQSFSRIAAESKINSNDKGLDNDIEVSLELLKRCVESVAN